MNVNITIPEFLLKRTEFVRPWQGPGLTKNATLDSDVLGALTPQFQYKTYRSRLRYLLREDASQSWFNMKFTGEIGMWEGIRWVTSWMPSK